MLHLGLHLANLPVALLGIEEVDAQSGCYNLALALFLPVDGEGVELLATEIHHREELVHESALEPSLCVLAHLGVGVPAMAPVASEVVVLAYGRTTHFHPWLLLFHGVVYLLYDAGDVSATLVAAHSDVPGLWVSDVVEMDAVYVVSAGYLPADVGEIGAGAAVLGVHVSIGAYLLDESRHALAERLASQGVPFAHGDGDHPGVKFHAPLVAFFDGKLQGIVARALAGES